MTTARTPMLAATLATLALASCSYSPGRYSGDGQLAPSATGTYRHQVEFAPIPLTTASTHTFRLAGLPQENMAAVLSINDASTAVMDAIDAAGVRVRMTLVSLADGSTSVKEGRLLGDWNTTYEGWVGNVGRVPDEFLGIWFRPLRHDAFTLTIDVSVAKPDAAGLPVSATPRVRGRAGNALGGVGNHLPTTAGGS
ncbi:MAG: hypothetical protein K2Q20_09965 [Phycisphaerales bacterium]|nr:hypothetical protein [Phycisphaerales bacterium]